MVGTLNPLIIACSGPGATRLIQDNILYAQQQAVVVGAMTVLSIFLWRIIRRWSALPCCILLLLTLHPAWTISAIQGDCGLFKAGAATVVTILSAACIGLQGVAGIWRKPGQPSPQ